MWLLVAWTAPAAGAARAAGRSSGRSSRAAAAASWGARRPTPSPARGAASSPPSATASTASSTICSAELTRRRLTPCASAARGSRYLTPTCGGGATRRCSALDGCRRPTLQLLRSAAR